MPFKVTDLLIDSVEPTAAESKKGPSQPKRDDWPVTTCDVPRPKCPNNTCGECTYQTCRCTICNTMTGSPSQCANPTSTKFSACTAHNAYQHDLERLSAALRSVIDAEKAA